MGNQEIDQFLSSIAKYRRGSSTTQSQALCALVFHISLCMTNLN